MRSLEAESDRWFLWIPVLFAGGILSYFALPDEPGAASAAALVIAAVGLCLAVRGSGLGLVVLRPRGPPGRQGQMGGILAGRRLHPAVNLRHSTSC
ncbi:MAG: hypothetical protein ACLQF1_07760 [Methyloceanibacter sp.]|jgi:hypothetical protein